MKIQNTGLIRVLGLGIADGRALTIW